jgi:hypothetical protein
MPGSSSGLMGRSNSVLPSARLRVSSSSKWFPFTIQIYISGHEWLARQLDRHRIAYKKIENGFTWIEEPERAQRFADKFVKKNWPGILQAIAKRFNPLLDDLLKSMNRTA